MPDPDTVKRWVCVCQDETAEEVVPVAALERASGALLAISSGHPDPRKLARDALERR